MPVKTKSLNQVENLFRRSRVIELSDLYETIQTTSRMTVFRRLRKFNYLSSYTHSGRYYTLYDIAQFSRDGLWHYKDIGFSRHGSLKKTITHLVNGSDTGLTHSELKQQLGVQVYNTLLELSDSKQINRERLKGYFLYTSIESKRAEKQIERRDILKAGGIEFGEQLPGWVIIEILAEVIRESGRELNVPEITSRLRKRGIGLTVNQINNVFEQYNLKKTLDLQRQNI
ncbi:MAG: hypothetical protein KAV18_02350 [Candidatus Omnitrophica bacterium]|nr:hypothetical protein [Candidatus Omnitrophota bacterium]